MHSCYTDTSKPINKKLLASQKDTNNLKVERTEKNENSNIIKKIKINQTDQNGLKQGIWHEYYNSGEIEGVYNYQNGKFNGCQYTFFKDGNLSGRVNYKNGIKHGEYITFTSDGYKKLYFLIDKGKTLVSRKSFQDEFSDLYIDSGYLNRIYFLMDSLHSIENDTIAVCPCALCPEQPIPYPTLNATKSK